jgi:hypothetical protein
LRLVLTGNINDYGADDPAPIVLPGEKKPVSSRDVSKFVNSEFIHYYNFYTDIKHIGNPYPCSFMDWPLWVIQLVKTFDMVVEEIKRHNEEQAYRMARGK